MFVCLFVCSQCLKYYNEACIKRVKMPNVRVCIKSCFVYQFVWLSVGVGVPVCVRVWFNLIRFVYLWQSSQLVELNMLVFCVCV